MNKKQLINSIKDIRSKYNDLKNNEINVLKEKYIKENCPFNIDDVVYHVTGVVEIKDVKLTNDYRFKYIGNRMKFIKGGFVTYTKHNKKHYIIDYDYSIKKLNKNRVKL